MTLPPRRPGAACAVVAISTVLLLPFSRTVGQETTVLRWVTDSDVVIERVHELDAAIERADWPFVCKTAQDLIDDLPLGEASNPVEPALAGLAVRDVHLVPSPGEPGVFISVREYATRRLAALPQAAIVVYRALHGDRADRSFAGAVSRGDRAALADLGERFRLTRGGQAALAALGHAAMESGDFAAAACRFEDLLDVAWNDEVAAVSRADAIAALALCFEQLGERTLLERLETECDGLAPTERNVSVAGLDLPVRTFVAQCRARVATTASRPASEVGTKWNTAWSSPAPGPVPKHLPPTTPSPQVVRDTVVYHTRDAVRALSLEDGAPRWTLTFGSKRTPDALTLRPLNGRGLRSLEGAVGGGLYILVGESDVASPRQLGAIDVDGGQPVWVQEGTLTGGADHPATRLRFDPAPVVTAHGIWSTAVDGADSPHSWVIRHDPRDGSRRWVARLASGLPLPFNLEDGEMPPLEYWLGCSPAATSRGLLFVADNLGHVAALDAESGRPRWLFTYERRQVESSSRFSRAAVARGFETSPVRVDGDRVVCAPEDADHWFMLSMRPAADAGHRRRNENWIINDRGDRGLFTSLLDFQDGVVRLAGKDDVTQEFAVMAFAPLDAKRLFRWLAPLDSSPLGRAASDRNEVYVCSRRYVYRIDATSGLVADPIASFESTAAPRPGNLFRTAGRLLVGSNSGVSCLVSGRE